MRDDTPSHWVSGFKEWTGPWRIIRSRDAEGRCYSRWTRNYRRTNGTLSWVTMKWNKS